MSSSPSLADLEALPIAQLRALHTLMTAALALRSLLGPERLAIDLVEDEGFSLVIGVPVGGEAAA